MAGFSDVSRFDKKRPMPAFARSGPSKPSVQSGSGGGTGETDDQRAMRRKQDEDARRKAAGTHF